MPEEPSASPRGQWIASLAEARAVPDAAVVLQGDDGGQVYLTCPVALVRSDEAGLRWLLRLIDARNWNDPTMATIYFRVLPVGSAVGGGMGGGRVIAGAWLHPELESESLRSDVERILFTQPAEELRDGIGRPRSV